MAAILARNCEHQIVVTHGFAITFVVASWVQMPVESTGYASFRAASGSITGLGEDDYFPNRQFVSLGDMGHLSS